MLCELMFNWNACVDLCEALENSLFQRYRNQYIYIYIYIHIQVYIIVKQTYEHTSVKHSGPGLKTLNIWNLRGNLAWCRFDEGVLDIPDPHERFLLANRTHGTWEMIQPFIKPLIVNILRPRQNGRHFPDDIFEWFFFNENFWISIKISPKFAPKGPTDNILALVQVMAWRRPGDKPLSEPMVDSLLTHIFVTRPQWVKTMDYPFGELSYFYKETIIVCFLCQIDCVFVTENDSNHKNTITGPINYKDMFNIRADLHKRYLGFTPFSPMYVLRKTSQASHQHSYIFNQDNVLEVSSCIVSAM